MLLPSELKHVVPSTFVQWYPIINSMNEKQGFETTLPAIALPGDKKHVPKEISFKLPIKEVNTGIYLY